MPRPGTLTALDAAGAARLAAQPLTYPAPEHVGGDPADRHPRSGPPGYRRFRRSAPIGRGEACLETAAEALLGWQVQLRSGIDVAASSPRVAPGVVVSMRVPLPLLPALTSPFPFLRPLTGALAVTAPCRVVDVVDQPDRRGFGYGTLPGHPASGAEWFEVVIDDDDVVRIEITAFSRNALPLTRLLPPLTAAAQDLMTRRYLRALA